MAGITSFSYRKLMNKFSCGLTYSEMISDFGLIYDNQKTKDLIQSDGSDRPLAIQLFGGSKETLLKAIDQLEKLNVDYDFLDINLACPVPKVTKNHSGSSWLLDQEKMFEMMEAICKKSKKPVTAKVRLGYSKINIDETVQTLEKAGVKFIAIHARTKDQGYTGKPNFEALKNIRNLIKIPFGVSGDIYTVKDALNALEITKADAILVARGGIGNPNLVRNINLALEEKEYDETVRIDEQIEYLREYSHLLKEELGNNRASAVLRGIAPKFFQNFVNSRLIRQKIALNLNSIDQLDEILNEIRDKKI